MPTPPIQPPTSVRSLGELFALAEALEGEAAARYAELADRMRGLGLPEVAAVFDRLVAEEEGHVAAVGQWARATIGAPPDPALLRWLPPDSFDEEAAGMIASSQLASAYRALSLAVRNEDRAFLLWAHIAALAEDAEVKKAAETMALEELRHGAMLRRERRRAFHAARPAPAPPPAAPEIERDLALGLAALARQPPFAASAAALQGLAAEAAAMAEEAVILGSPDASAPPLAAGTDLAGMRRLAERAAELYIGAADAARDETALLRLQSLAHRAVARIARLGAMG